MLDCRSNDEAIELLQEVKKDYQNIMFDAGKSTGEIQLKLSIIDVVQKYLGYIP